MNRPKENLLECAESSPIESGAEGAGPDFHTQKLEVLGKIAGSVAHDFNNILASILGRCELLLDRLQETDPLFQEIMQIRYAGEKGAILSKQILDFGRKRTYCPREINLNEIIRSMEGLLRRLLTQNILFTLSLEENLRYIRADYGRLEQVILNLVINARDAMPHGGWMTLETGRIDLDKTFTDNFPGASSGPHIMLALSDTGEGMSESVRARIFEAFYTTKPSGKGTGLGLTTVSDITKECNGCIVVQSEPGKGTTFRLYFPEIAGAVVPSQEPLTRDAKVCYKGNETILVVEDDQSIRELMGQMLALGGYKAILAADATEALNLVGMHGDKLNLVMTDIMLPRKNGVEIVKELLTIKRDLKVIYTSGYPDEILSRFSASEMAPYFLQKPFTVDALLGKVRKLLDG